MDILEQIDKFIVSEMNKSTFEKQIKRTRGDKKRLKALRSTIVDMGHGGMLSKKDVDDLISQISNF